MWLQPVAVADRRVVVPRCGGSHPHRLHRRWVNEMGWTRRSVVLVVLFSLLASYIGVHVLLCGPQSVSESRHVRVRVNVQTYKMAVLKAPHKGTRSTYMRVSGYLYGTGR